MKNSSLSIFIILFIALSSCSKKNVEENAITYANHEEIESILEDLHNTSDVELRGWWEDVKNWVKKAWNWVKDHAGTTPKRYGVICQGDMPCGPCKGICIEWGLVETGNGAYTNEYYYLAMPDSDSSLTTIEINAGLELYKLTLILNDSTNEYKLLFEFDPQSNFITPDSNLIIQNNTYLGATENNFASFTNIIGTSGGHIVLEGGIYPVFYNSSTQKFETIVDFYTE